MITKRDYIAVAAIIATQVKSLSIDGVENFYPNGEAYTVLEQTAFGLADLFATQNPRFDRARFLTACDLLEKSVSA